MPDTLAFSDNDISPEFRGTVSLLRWAVTNFNALYYGLIALMVLLALCLFALYRDVKGFSRSLGSTLLSVGMVGFAGIWVSERLILPQGGSFGLPPELGRWFSQFMIDIGEPLKGLYIGLAAGGLILFLLSIFYRRGAGKDAAVPPAG